LRLELLWVGIADTSVLGLVERVERLPQNAIWISGPTLFGFRVATRSNAFWKIGRFSLLHLFEQGLQLALLVYLKSGMTKAWGCAAGFEYEIHTRIIQ
jgi:hypothetical protein